MLAMLSTGCGGDSSVEPSPPEGEPIPSSVRVSPPFAAFTSFDEGLRVTARVRDRTGAVIPGVPVVWETAAPHIASVSDDGEIRARGNGRTFVFARVGNSQGTVAVEVRQVAVDFALGRDSLVLPWSGAEFAVEATGIDAGGSPLEPGADVEWTSVDDEIASVSPFGVVTGLRRGSTTVFARSGSRPDTLEVRVASSEPGRPEIFLVSPLQVTGGDTLRILGERFGNEPELNEVVVDAASAEVVAATDTLVAVVVPRSDDCTPARFVTVTLIAFGEEDRTQVRLLPPAGCS